MLRFPTCVIFGGTGFIGSHFAQFLIHNNLADHVYLADISGKRTDFNFDSEKIHYLKVDVRNHIDSHELPKNVELIVNLAAIHREPGHDAHEYFETNIRGAENVCIWAEHVACKHIVFTSSIAPYGPTETPKTEESLPIPISPYGSSKLVAEKIHSAWQRGGSDRRLVIVRPGVVFGAGEKGNVSRLIKATIGRYFFYMGNKSTSKAGGYVKELINTIIWALEKVNKSETGLFLYNFTMEKPPTIEEYVLTTCKVSGISRYVPSVPYSFLYFISILIESVAKPLGINQPISPVRIRKLIRSNNIEPNVLRKEGYTYKYTLQEAMLDWKIERPDEWK